jgi:hypothetical protein
MDVGAFVQENKRWLLGCAIGGVVWLVASTVVNSIYTWTNPNAKALGAPTGDVFDQASLTAAREESEKLAAERQRLQQALAFVPTPKYQLANNGKPDEYLLLTGRNLRETILAGANRRDVQLQETAISWDTPTTIDDIRGTLFALELLDEVQQRLFAAHDAARAAAEDAMGLRQVLALKIERRARAPARVRQGEVDPRDFFTQEQVAFQFQADEPTIHAFCESLRKPGRNLVLDAWQVSKPARPGEACSVKGSVLGIAFKEAGAASTASVEAPSATGAAVAKGGR